MKFLVISSFHDYRSHRKANIHFITNELAKRGTVVFFSIRFSLLTRFKIEPRLHLWNAANQLVMHNGVKCYLWRTLIHPFNIGRRFLRIEWLLFKLLSSSLPGEIVKSIRSTDTVIIESGMGIIYAGLIKRINPSVRLIYVASDGLETINQAEYIKRYFDSNAHLFEFARLPSRHMAPEMPKKLTCFYIPHGLATDDTFNRDYERPFSKSGKHAVAVGSMLFDPEFFVIATALFPEITFHIIGSGYKGKSIDGAIFYDEMPFEKTVAYLKHADLAIAPYNRTAPAYLTETSMKLAQYNYMGIAAVCPAAVAGGKGRFGYVPGDPASIGDAIRRALSAGIIERDQPLSWAEVTDRLLAPETFADTTLEITSGSLSLPATHFADRKDVISVLPSR